MVSNNTKSFQNPLDFIRSKPPKLDSLNTILSGGGNLLDILDPNWQNINIAPTITKIDNIFTNNDRYYSAVLHSNGKIYAIPSIKYQILEIDVENKTSTIIDIDKDTLSNPKASDIGHHFGSVLHPNGKIYVMPYDQNKILEIDVENRTVKGIGSDIITGSIVRPGKILYKPRKAIYNKCTYSPITNKIYAMPREGSGNVEEIMEFDVDTEEINFFGPGINDPSGYSILGTARGGIITHLNGNMYSVGHHRISTSNNIQHKYIFEINPSTKTVNLLNMTNQLSYITDNIRFITGLNYHPFTNKLYITPAAQKKILEIDINDINNITGFDLDSDYYNSEVDDSIVIAPNGKFYYIGRKTPSNYQCLLEIDIINKTTNFYYGSDQSFFGNINIFNRLILHPNGKIYTITGDTNTTYMLEIDLGCKSKNPNIVFSPYFNKS
jgi:hypothetical protein